ncbi:MAG: hypothetical protein J5865_08260 [Lachnospiraceae bacterium]|nr:hypothetical protein [Lachnospiraceae bacterium]
MKQLFLCYRREGAQTAKLFSFYMKKNHPEINVWYSDKEREGNYSLDPPSLIRDSYGAVIFLSENFTKGFLDKNGNINLNRYRSEYGRECPTVLEIIEIEKNLQSRDDFELHIVNLNGAKFTKKERKILETVFSKAGILRPDSVTRFAERNMNSFETAKDHEDAFFDRMIGAYLPSSIEAFVKGDLSIGSCNTTIDVLCWDCTDFISPDHIVYELDGTDIPLYDKIEAAAFSGAPVTQDDDVVSVVQYEQSLTTNEEKKHLKISFKLSKYHLFKKALELWDKNNFSMSKEIAGYLNSPEDDRYYPIPNAMGLALMVLSSDNKLVFSRRSTKRKVRSHEFDCSIVEGLLPVVDKKLNGQRVCYDFTDPSYIRKECWRAFCEELCAADESSMTVSLFGLILDRKYGQWNWIGLIRSDLKASEIEERHPTRDDTTEKNTLYFIDYLDQNGKPCIGPIRETVQLFRQDGLWDTALAVLYGTLTILGFSREEIDDLL